MNKMSKQNLIGTNWVMRMETVDDVLFAITLLLLKQYIQRKIIIQP